MSAAAGSNRRVVLSLYKQLLRTGKEHPHYNFREFIMRRTREDFRENKVRFRLVLFRSFMCSISYRLLTVLLFEIRIFVTNILLLLLFFCYTSRQPSLSIVKEKYSQSPLQQNVSDPEVVKTLIAKGEWVGCCHHILVSKVLRLLSNLNVQ